MKVFEDINKLIVEGSLAVGNHSIVLDFVLGSDYKVIVIIIIMMYSTDSMSTSQYLLIVMGLMIPRATMHVFGVLYTHVKKGLLINT